MSGIDLESLIKGDKKALANKVGHTPLFALAESVAQHVGPVGSDQIEDLVSKLDLKSFNIEELNTLNSFIYYSKIGVGRITDLYENFLESNRNIVNEADITKRGILLRFIIERDRERNSKERILNEQSLRECSPWIWIDCISYYDWDLATSEIFYRMKIKINEFKDLLCRIPSFQKRISVDDLVSSIEAWRLTMSEEYKDKLDKWVTRFKTQNISTKLRNVGFFQKKVAYASCA